MTNQWPGASLPPQGSDGNFSEYLQYNSPCQSHSMLKELLTPHQPAELQAGCLHRSLLISCSPPRPWNRAPATAPHLCGHQPAVEPRRGPRATGCSIHNAVLLIVQSASSPAVAAVLYLTKSVQLEMPRRPRKDWKQYRSMQDITNPQRPS